MKPGSGNFCPEHRKRPLDHMASYAEELERETEECARDLYDAFYVELALVKRDYGAEIAGKLFDYGEHFTFNLLELRGAARLLANGWSLEQVEAYTVENGCDASMEEAAESRSRPESISEWGCELSGNARGTV